MTSCRPLACCNKTDSSMKIDGLLTLLPRGVRVFLACFVVALSVGFYTGLAFVGQTGSTSPSGVETQYLGNEEDEEAEVMVFKKSPREMLSIVHAHVLSMSLIFLLLGALVWACRLPAGLKAFLTIEPFASLLATFGGLCLVWLGWPGWSYLVIFSGSLMTLTFTVSASIVLYQLLWPGRLQTGI